MKLTDDHYQQLVENGYVIIPGYFSGQTLAELAAAQRRAMKTWEEIKDNPPADRTLFIEFPRPEFILNRAIVDHELINLGKRYLKTEQVYIRVGVMLARYPGFRGDNSVHFDDGNNSLLPPSESHREFSQLSYWAHLEDVEADQAPLQLIPTRYGNDLSKAEKFICKGGTVCVFTTYTQHSAGDYTRADGQRFTWGFGLSRADCPWQGFRHYTSQALHPEFRKLISSLTAKERELFRFPPPGHHYYTKQTLAALEERYPGWNARGEYEA